MYELALLALGRPILTRVPIPVLDGRHFNAFEPSLTVRIAQLSRVEAARSRFFSDTQQFVDLVVAEFERADLHKIYASDL